jgi:hypothetical protein
MNATMPTSSPETGPGATQAPETTGTASGVLEGPQIAAGDLIAIWAALESSRAPGRDHLRQIVYTAYQHTHPTESETP